MTKSDLVRYQRERTAQELYNLAMQCRRRFLRSAELVGMRSNAIERLRQLGYEAVNLEPLFPAWRVICDRYISEYYDPQMDLFTEPDTQVQMAWSSFIYHKLFPALVREDELVRNVLRALDGLPCQSPKEAADSVRHYVSEMSLPFTPPPWAPEEEID